MMEHMQPRLSSSPNGSTPPLPVCVMGVGQAGINVLDLLVMHGQERMMSLAIDTDQMVIEGSVAEHKLLLGATTTRGLGCTGDVMRGRQVWQAESFSVEQTLKGQRQLIIVTGLGGGTGSAFALEAAKMARAQEMKVVVVAVMPFAFESTMRLEVARRVLRDIRGAADVVMTLANDRILAWPMARENIRRCYHQLNQVIGQGVQSILHILNAPGMMPLEISDLQGVYGRLHREEVYENCWMGTGEIHQGDTMESLVDGTLQSPLLADAQAWAQADTCLACLTGGNDLALADLQTLTQQLERKLSNRITVRLGAKLLPGYEGRLRLSLLLSMSTVPVSPSMAELFVPDTLKPALPSAPQPPINRPTMASRPVPEIKPPEPVVEVAATTKPKVTLIKHEPVMEEELGGVGAKPPSSSGSEEGGKPPQRPKRRASKQEELPFEGNRGRFDKSFETIYRGENLDQPTYRRRRLAIKV
jgi:cell division GTPase FtsZ